MNRLTAVTTGALAASLSLLCVRAEAGQTRNAGDLKATLEAAEAARQPPPSLRGFSLTLVQGDLKGPSTSEGVPPAVARALADLKDFLPYKSYVLLDTQWTVGTGAIKSRLRRPDGAAYDLEMTAGYGVFGRSGATGIRISGFHLREASVPGKDQADLDEYVRSLEQSIDKAKTDLAALRDIGRLSADEEESRSQSIRQMTRELLTARGLPDTTAKASLIDTSFQMTIGETVVVGTSRLQGDRALIVLVTAVGR